MDLGRLVAWQVIPVVLVAEMLVASLVAVVCGRWRYAAYWAGAAVVNVAAVFMAQQGR